MGPLSPDRQAPPVPEAPVAPQVHQALDIHGDFPTQVPFYLASMVDHLADAGDFGVGEFGRLGARLHLRFLEHPCRSVAPDAENIG